MWVVVYLLVGLAILGRHSRQEIRECGGVEAVVLIGLWPLYLVYLVMEWVGEAIVRGWREG